MSTAIVVPGHGAFAGGSYRISDRCRRLVAEAERAARALDPVAVVFTGWSPAAGPSEAEQMRDAWRGPDVELVVEPTARVTAENAARTLPLVRARHAESAVVVCAPLHYVRTRFFFRRLYGAYGVETRFRVVAAELSPRALAWELAALPVAPAQLRAARAELARVLR